MKRKNSSPDEPRPAKRPALTADTSISTPKSSKTKKLVSVSTPTSVSADTGTASSETRPTGPKAAVPRNNSISTPVEVARSANSAAASPVPRLGATKLSFKPSLGREKKVNGVGTPTVSSSNKKLKGILKFNSPQVETPGTPTRNVSFQPMEGSVRTTLEKMKTKTAKPEELDDLLAVIVTNKGKGLVLCLEELKEYIQFLDKDHSSIIEQIVMIPWVNLDQEAVKAFRRLLLSLVSYHPFLSKIVIRSLLRQFTPQMENGLILPVSQNTNKNIHSFFQSFLKKFGREKKDLLKQMSNLFPFFKNTSEKLVCYLRGILEMYNYMSDRRSDILEIVVEKCIQLDAGLTRAQIRSYANMKKEQACQKEDAATQCDEKEHPDTSDLLELNGIDKRLCESLDLCMEELFKFLRVQTFVKAEVKQEELEVEQETGEENMVYSGESAEQIEEILSKILVSHLLTSDKLGHLQFLQFYLASQNPNYGKKLLNLCWSIFEEANQASIIRQAAVSYLSGFVCRGEKMGASLAKKWLKKMIKWIHMYMSGDSSHDVDYMVVNLAAHGPMYSACQAAFYMIAFRHKDLVKEEDVSFFTSLQLNSIITHPLNPLRVVSPGVLKAFSHVMSKYQIVYCNTIIQRNNRITLPVVGLSSAGQSDVEGKPLLLDNYFPFDPYLLPRTAHVIEPIYRKYQAGIEAESDFDSEEEEEEDFEFALEDVADAEEKLLESYSRRRRTVSGSSSTLTRRSRTTSMTEAISRELDII